MEDSASAPRRLAGATSPEVAAWGRPILLLPIGSTEQHGPHLAVSTDTVVAEALCRGLAERRPDVVVAPSLAIGASGEHAGFAGTLSIGTEVLAAVVTEVVRSSRPAFCAVVAVSGHGGNAEALARAEALAAAEGDDLLILFPAFPGGDAHAGRTETSLLLALEPSLVRKDEAMAGNTAPLSALVADLRHGGVARVSPNGVLGDPVGATAAEGVRLLDAALADLAARLDERHPR